MTVGEVTDYLLENYYAHYKNPKFPDPTREALATVLYEHQDKVIIIENEKGIRGVAVFLTLSDQTYSWLEALDICDVQLLTQLLSEKGDNVHFILVTAKGIRTILQGIDLIKKMKNPKTISWWNPSMSRLHKYLMN